MSEKITGFDSIGMTELGLLQDGRVNIEFTGTDGAKQVTFFPASIMSQLVMSLIAFNAKIAEATEQTDDLAFQNTSKVKEFSVGSNDQGTEFAVAFRNTDDLVLSFGLDANSTESLTVALLSALSEHGITPRLQNPEGSGQSH